ncbi:MAG: DUF5018 domain-containing protein [Muribaculaceae bacterium]|nr:DUF5018 domain-containing protein [Muribaculaceae bacterium]
MMKNKILSIISLFMLLLSVNACQSPEEFTPSGTKNGINNFTVSFIGDTRDENKFTSEIDYANKVITVVFPFNYPRLSDNELTMNMLSDVRVVADLDNNASISPRLLKMDLTKENYITVKDAFGVESQYKVVAEIRKSAECVITNYVIPSKSLTGIINEEAKTITMISINEIGKVLADVAVSHGATLSPNPVVTALDYDKEQKITVTAQNGTNTSVYTIKKGIPQKVASGIRPGSAKLLWAKKLTEIGCKVDHMTTGIATMGDYLLVNERANANVVYLDCKSGDVAGTVNISSFAGSLTNFYATGDDNGNALFVNLASSSNKTVTMWRVKGVKGTPEKYLEYANPNGLDLGRKMSIAGSLDGNAIITIPVIKTKGQFARWQVINGSLVSTDPVFVTAGLADSWGTNADIVYTDPTNLNSNYLGAFYAEPRGASLFNGTTNAIMSTAAAVSANWIQNAIDYAQFNKIGYAVSNSVNSFTWGTDDSVYMFDVAGNTMDNNPIDFSSKGLNINGVYGAKAIGQKNPNGTGDVALNVSSDGFYLYVYFMFTNGYVGCVQCDCIDM